ncbi:F-box/LRR-repeat protein [Trifolium repens]|nr:F-box/LRR-repeat protein [Trifolium repens]
METSASSSKSNVPKRMAKTRKRKMAAEASYCSYLPQDELWECIFKFLDGDNHTLKSLSLVSKQFLSITNRLLFSPLKSQIKLYVSLAASVLLISARTVNFFKRSS